MKQLFEAEWLRACRNGICLVQWSTVWHTGSTQLIAKRGYTINLKSFPIGVARKSIKSK